jgi:DNA-directed RNA polymerase alpha subunit
MMNAIDRIVNELAAGKKISEALSTIYSKRRLSIPYKDEWFNVYVTDIGMTNRTTNCLMRAHLKTIRDVVNYVEFNKISDVRNMGTASCIEIMETILNYAWDKMSDKEKAEFLVDTVVRNERYLKA